VTHTGSRPKVAIVVADGRWPDGLDPLHAEAKLSLVSSTADFDALSAELDAVAVYDFRTRILHQADWSKVERLRWVHAASAGVDAAMPPPVVERDIVVTNARGVFDGAMAEYVLGLMLMIAKDFRRSLRLQDERRWLHRESQMLRRKRLVVVGAGSIGTAIAELASAAGVHVDGVARTARRSPPFGEVVAAEDMAPLLSTADFVAIAAPLTPATEGLFDPAAFAAMKPGAWLINVGRGPIVDELALLAALRSGHLGGAALDVFGQEPLPQDHPFWAMENVFVSPHMSGDFIGWVEDLSRMFVDNFRRWVAGQPLHNVVDKQQAV
jgi:phosphoglycerate dehydrogenase-like enzyme